MDIRELDGKCIIAQADIRTFDGKSPFERCIKLYKEGDNWKFICNPNASVPYIVGLISNGAMRQLKTIQGVLRIPKETQIQVSKLVPRDKPKKCIITLWDSDWRPGKEPLPPPSSDKAMFSLPWKVHQDQDDRDSGVVLVVDSNGFVKATIDFSDDYDELLATAEFIVKCVNAKGA